ncbi:Alpha/Beta hydrolase protein [Mariannaea sp. PMI_226]|nr:Alpha/Beta hydrolase protein [Mariannaea sp. PMI_226]
MADFTKYSSPASEWVEYEAAHPVPNMPPGISHEQRKALFNTAREKAFAEALGPVKGVAAIDVSIPTSDESLIAVRIYRLEDDLDALLPLYIHLHAGGFYFGNIETEDVWCRLLCINTRSVVMNVNYRHTPEWTFPTPMQDTFDALDWIIKEYRTYNVDKRSVIIGGISAGAALACAAMLREQDNATNRISGLILTVPPTVDEADYPRYLLKDGYTSLEQNADAAILPRTSLKFFQSLYKADRGHPYTSPLVLPESSFHGFPPTCFHIAGLDPLRDEGLLFARKLAKAGVETRVDIYPGFPHAFMTLPELAESERWRNDLYKGVSWIRKSQSLG